MKTSAASSDALWQAADNLLDKIETAIEEDDRERAQRYIRGGQRLNFDEHEQQHPFTMALHQRWFTAVTDALEESDRNDPRWLTYTLEAVKGAGSATRAETRRILEIILDDYETTHREKQQITAAASTLPALAEEHAVPPTSQEVLDTLNALLRLYGFLEAAAFNRD
ncbi:hypothetical protein GCM10027591_16840 [Zhihengliuella somnathii]